MKIRPVEDIYNDMLAEFPCTLKEASEDVNKPSIDKYMTLSEIPVVKFDAFKNAFVKNMALTGTPMSCDVLYMTTRNDELFLIEFKNGIIEAKKNYEIRVKIFESLLMLSEEFSRTIEFTRNNLVFILVYNENVEHGPKEFHDIGINSIQKSLFDLARIRKIRFGLHRFKKLYFKEVYTYSKAEFESEFVDKYCVC